MKIDIYGSVKELATLIKQDKSLLEKDLYQQGNTMLALYQDANFTDSFQNFKELKIELFRMAVEDLAMGGMTLRTSVIGLAFQNNKVKTYIAPFGVNPQGNVMFSMRDMAAFKNWREGDGNEIPQEVLNAGIYRITVALSELL